MQALTSAPDYPIYHYTACEALVSIIGSNVLRASSLDLMNDAPEIRLAASVFRACLDRRAAVSSGKALGLLSAMQTRMRAVLVIKNVYSVSFSRSLYDIGMWKLYADKGRGFAFSVSIGRTTRFAARYTNADMAKRRSLIFAPRFSRRRRSSSSPVSKRLKMMKSSGAPILIFTVQTCGLARQAAASAGLRNISCGGKPEALGSGPLAPGWRVRHCLRDRRSGLRR